MFFIPFAVGLLTNLSRLILEENRLSATLPSEVGNMAALRDLWLSNNLLSGSIPTELSLISELRDFRASNTGSGGTVPPEFAKLGLLEWLVLNGMSVIILRRLMLVYHHLTLVFSMRYYTDNNFQGTLLSEFGNMMSLTKLFLQANDFTGTIPTSFGRLGNLTALSLNDCLLSGTIPPELGLLSHLDSLNLDKNMLSGSVPLEVCDLRKHQLNIFVVDCATSQSTGLTTGVLWGVCACCTSCRSE